MLTIAPPEEVLSICRHLRELGHQAWLVGGAVRDSLMGRTPHDWDIATSALPDAVANAFPATVLTGARHGTVTILISHSAYEVTTFRTDGTYSDGRHPDSVTFASTIDEDLGRRDFTCNAIAYDPVSGEWRDPFQGLCDIKIHLLRAVGKPEDRFREDGLRVLRAVRFAATLDFEIDPDTTKALSTSTLPLEHVANERKHDELIKIMGARKPSRAFELAQHLGLLFAMGIGELRDTVGCAQNRYHAYDVWKHTLLTVDACPSLDPVLRVAALLHDVAKPQTRGVHPAHGGFTFHGHEDVGAEWSKVILQRLKFSTADIERVAHLIRHHIIAVDADSSKPALRRFARKIGNEHLPSLFELARADIAAKGPAEAGRDIGKIDALERRLAELSVTEPQVKSTVDLAIDGRDVMEALGVRPGPQVGACLRRLLDAVTDDPSLNNRESLIALVKP